MAKYTHPKINPSTCIQSLQEYQQNIVLLRNMIPEAISSLREFGTPSSIYIADTLEKHNNAVQVFHDYIPEWLVLCKYIYCLKIVGCLCPKCRKLKVSIIGENRMENRDKQTSSLRYNVFARIAYSCSCFLKYLLFNSIGGAGLDGVM